MKPKAHYEYLPVFERNIIYGNDLDAIRKKALEYFDEHDIDFSGLECDSNPYGLATSIDSRVNPGKVLFFIMYVRDDADIGTVSHESLHTKNHIWSYIGQLADEANDEADAYLIGHLTKVFMEEIRGVKKLQRELIKGDKKGNLKR
jgi:hypothetical protein